MIRFLRNNFALILVIAISLFSVVPFFAEGFFIFHDDTQVPRVYEMGKSLSHGMFPVRWVQDLGYGFGYPIFNFYSLIPYYLGGFLTLIGLNALLSTKIVFIAGILLSGVSMFYLVKNVFGKLPAVVAALIYVYFPYHAVNIYVRGDLAELFAYSFLPLVFLGLFKIHTFGFDRKYIALTSVSVAAVALSHNLTAFMLVIFVSLFVIFSLIWGKDRRKLIVAYSLALLIAFLISAFYSIPTLLEMKYTNVLSQVGGGSHYPDHFLCVSQLWDSQWGYGGSAPGCLDGMSYKLGKVNVILSLLSLITFILISKRVKDKFIPIVSFAFLGLSIFMTLPYSSIIWNLPYMDFLQFPWRFLNFAGVFIALAVGLLVHLFAEKITFKGAMVLSLIVVSLTFFVNLKLFAPERYIDRSNEDYTNEKSIRWTISKISDEYLPKNFSKPTREEDLREARFEIIKGRGSINITQDKTAKAEAVLNLSEKSDLRANIAFFPSWNIEVDGKPISYVVKQDGMYFSVPEGEHRLKATFRQTIIEKFSNGLTIIGLFVLGLVIIGKLSYKKLSFGK